MDVTSILIALSATLSLLVVFIYWKQNYWHRKGIFSPECDFFWGHTRPIITQKESFGDFLKRFYSVLKSNNQIHGGFYAFLMKGYVPIEPALIKKILQDDFEHFSDRGLYYNEYQDPLSAHLYALAGERWRKFRLKLNTVLTTDKMAMFEETLMKYGQNLNGLMDEINETSSVNMKVILSRFTSDVMGSCIFGKECNSLLDKNCEFRKQTRLYTQLKSQNSIKQLLTYVLPNVSLALGISVVNQRFGKFFMETIAKNVQDREKKYVWKKDMMHFFIQLKNQGQFYDHDNLYKKACDKDETFLATFNELAALSFGFFTAGYETTCNVLCFCLYELAANEEVQEKLRSEINQVLNEEPTSVEALIRMHYLDKVINETLRKYPPVPVLNRVCTKNYRVPGTNVEIEKGTKLLIPIIGLHHDEEFYPDSDKFDPERFSPENIASRPAFSFLPFGSGPRNCIGIRFAMMQLKVGLSVLIKNYKFNVSSKMTWPIMDRKSVMLNCEGGIWLDFCKV